MITKKIQLTLNDLIVKIHFANHKNTNIHTFDIKDELRDQQEKNIRMQAELHETIGKIEEFL